MLKNIASNTSLHRVARSSRHWQAAAELSVSPSSLRPAFEFKNLYL